MGRKNRGQSPPRSAATGEALDGAINVAGSSTEPIKEPTPPMKVFYCQVCTFPLEYCEFGSSLTKCKEWLKDEDEDLYNKYYSEEALAAKIGTLSVAAQSALEQSTSKAEAKASAKATLALQKKLASHIIIKRIERTKRKHVTSISGLEAFDIDLKKAAKQLAGKFATGASVSKNAAGLEEVVVQGDVADDVRSMIEKGDGVLKGIPKENVEIVEDKKKKGE
ncbi:translation initiation factor SUI1 [Crepidotus variabilis]|uniref:Translation machinery-associated protein 22 n=1 Tax=Crepidotus variabilis TaxID=179855 RepID=A0A9P6JW69_9AGAR|nr:translation initiation factor SUI1 [Crepidotus variabilis]